MFSEEYCGSWIVYAWVERTKLIGVMVGLTGHLKWKGTLIGALLEIDVWSARMTFVWPVPNVQGGSAEITSSGCLRQILKKM